MGHGLEGRLDLADGMGQVDARDGMTSAASVVVHVDAGRRNDEMPGLRIRTEIGAPPERCFDLSRSIDLHVESMAASRERAVAGVTSGLIGFGQEVSWEARHFGRLWRMTSRITEFESPHRFVDEMVSGPFRRFRHEHCFEPSGEGTLMTDVVEFQMPGWLIVNTVAAAYLRHLLVTRNGLIRSKAERG